MTTYNCVMLGVMNPILPLVHTEVLSRYSKYINRDYIKENCIHWKSFFELDPHITLMYGFTPGIGKHELTNFIRIKDRKNYLDLLNTGHLDIPDPKINMFDCDDHKVLKIDFNDCKEYDLLKSIHTSLKSFNNDYKFPDYNPHVTITYLTNDAPDEICECLTKKFSKLLSRFIIGDFIISSESGDQVRFK